MTPYSLNKIKTHYLVEHVKIRKDKLKTYQIILKCGEKIEETYLRDATLILKFLEIADKQKKQSRKYIP